MALPPNEMLNWFRLLLRDRVDKKGGNTATARPWWTGFFVGDKKTRWDSDGKVFKG